MTPPKEIIRLGPIESASCSTATTRRSPVDVRVSRAAGGAGPAPHYHDQVDETLYGLEGVLTFTVDGRPTRSTRRPLLRPARRRPPLRQHQRRNHRTLAMLTPALIGPAYFRDIVALLSAGGPPDPVRIAEVMRRHGLIVVPPSAG